MDAPRHSLKRRLRLALIILLMAGCQSPAPPRPAALDAPPAPPQLDLDQLLTWLDRSPLRYDLTAQARPAPGFEGFFQAGLPAIRVPLDRRALRRRLAALEAPPGPNRQRLIEDAVLVDARGGEAWGVYLRLLAQEGRGLPPAPLLPPGTARLLPKGAGAEILYPRGGEAWAFYLVCKAAARLEPAFRRRLGAPEATPYRWTLAEERGCLQIFAQAVSRAAAEGTPPRGLAAHILAAARAGVLEGYIVVEALGALAPGALPDLPPGARRAGRSYLRWAARPVAGLPPADLTAGALAAGAALPPPPLTADDQLRLEAAQAALSAGAVARSARVLGELAQRHPRAPAVWRILAHARMLTGDTAGAVRAATEAERLAPGDPATWALLARGQLTLGDAEAARRYADRLRWLWWLGRDAGLMRAPILLWGSVEGGAVLERLDVVEAGTPRFWWIRPPTSGESRPLSEALDAQTPGQALAEAADR